MNNIGAIHRANETELKLGLAGGSGSWHTRYAHSSVIYVGGIPDSLTEDDVLTIFEQMGRIVHINRVRDKETGKPRGFAFIAYHDVRSTVIAVDNFNGIKILGSTLCVDHVDNYKPPDPETTTPFQLPDDTQIEDARPQTTGKFPTNANKDAHQTIQNTVSSIQKPADDSEDYRVRKMMQRLAAMRRQRTLLEEQGSQSDPFASRATAHPNSYSNHPTEIDPVVENSSDQTSLEEDERPSFRPDKDKKCMKRREEDERPSFRQEKDQKRMKRREERRRIRESRAERRSKEDANRNKHGRTTQP
jgi:RNA-binding motif protein, X-linked 2